MSDNSSDDSFGGNLASSSIYFEDPDAAEQLSLIISNFHKNGLKDGIKELNEKIKSLESDQVSLDSLKASNEKIINNFEGLLK